MRIVYFIFILLSIGFLSNSSLHPSGNTGAPGDSFCGACHTGNGGALDGEISITGFPATIMPSTTYNLTVTTTNPAVNATRAGFQILVLDQGNNNIGTFSNNPSDTQIRMQSGRFYLGHKPAKFFSGASSVSWTTDWTSPASGSGPVTIYGASVIANGSGGNSGDRAVLTNESGSFQGGGSPLAVSVTEDNPTTCSDSADGQATASPTGGTPPYEYDWDNGETTMQAINLSPGTHFVTVTDAVNASISDQVFINSPAPVQGTIISQGDAICNGQNSGFANLSASGGTPSYSFNWSDGGSGASRNNLFAGNYSITISDGNNCEETLSLTINEPNQLDVSETITDVSCNDGNDGMIMITPMGGTGSGYSYQWSNGSSNQNQNNLQAGTYSLTLFDSNNCSNTFQFDVDEPSELSISIDNASDALCNGQANGSAEISGNGGTSPYTFNWSDGGSGSIRNDLSAGTYTINVIDNNLCEALASITIGEPNAIVIDSINAIPASCPGVDDGSLTASASGGSNNFSYLWSNGDNGTTATNLTAGVHSVTVTDNNNCTSEAVFTLGALSSAVLTEVNTTAVSCNGGSDGTASITISNGNGYEINWSNGDVGENVEGLAAGNYTVQATNGSGCISNELTISITEPAPITIATSLITQPLCFGDNNGSITVEATGGTGDLDYLWSNGTNSATIEQLGSGIYSLLTTDQNGCIGLDTFEITDPDLIVVDSISIGDITCAGQNSGSLEVFTSGGTGPLSYLWSTGSSSALIENLIAGEYSFIAMDTNMCTFLDTITLTEPTYISIDSTQIIEPTCHDDADGSVEVFSSGGTGTLSYFWENGDLTSIADSLSAGVYSLVIADANGCLDTNEIMITQPDALNATASIINESEVGENDGAIIVFPTGGVPGYTFDWSNGATSDSIEGLEPGEYTVLITDMNGCFITKTYNIASGDCQLAATYTTFDVSCFGNNDGQIIIDVTGNNGDFNFEINPPNGNLDSLPPGTYQVLVTDDNQCNFLINDIVINEPSPIVITVDQVVDADATNNGSISVTSAGGTPGYIYTWTNSEGEVVGENEDLTEVGAGVYILQIIDSRGCIVTSTAIEIKFLSGTNELLNQISISPNPVLDIINIKHPNLINQLRIFAINGDLVQTEYPNANNAKIITQLKKGLYIIELSTSNLVTRHKIVVL